MHRSQLGGIKGNRTKNHEAHTAPTKFGMGDYYGQGVKAKIGRMRDSSPGINPVPREELKKPPRSLA